MRIHALVLVALFAAPAPAAETAGPSNRFTLHAHLRPLAISDCGRFAVEAAARYAPEAESNDARFRLKAVNVPRTGCDGGADSLFSNDFEAP
jgi:hypothetical protein